MNIEIATNSQALQLLSNESFRTEWEALCDRCPWATPFQSARFGRVWWLVYARQFEPLIVMSRSDDGTLRGLLVLARSKADGSLIVAGGRHAEYQAWICEPQIGDEFPRHAIATLRQAFPTSKLTFQYLPPNTPTAWLGDARVSGYCHLRTHRRPVWELGNGQSIAASLKKSSNKNRVRHLKKLGAFEFRRVTDPIEFDELFDQMVELYDLRHGAVHGSSFCSIDHQKEFHTALFREPGLMHATVLKAGGRLVAAHFGVCSKAEVHFGTIVHDPQLARHSPGKVQYLLLAQMLQQEGFARADLTPGDDAYKERHATGWDEVYTLSIWPTKLSRSKAAATTRAAAMVKHVLKRRGMTVVHARNQIRRLGGPRRAASILFRHAAAWMADRQETGIYIREFADHEPLPDAPAPQSIVRRDAWRDLLAYQPTATGRCRQSFLANALKRLEAGEHAYTVTEAGKLVHLAWMATPPIGDETTAALAGFPIPEGSVLVQDSGLFDSASSAQARSATLQAMLPDATEVPGVRRAIVLLPARLASQDLTEHAGLVYAGSIRHTTRFGRRRVRTEFAGEIGNSTFRGDSQAVVEGRMHAAVRYAIPAEEAHLTPESAYPVLS